VLDAMHVRTERQTRPVHSPGWEVCHVPEYGDAVYNEENICVTPTPPCVASGATFDRRGHAGGAENDGRANAGHERAGQKLQC